MSKKNKKQNIHDMGIQDRIQQIKDEDRFSLLAIVSNVEYVSKCGGGGNLDIAGELDILKLYFNGVIGIEEVKCNEQGMNKAQKQLRRAGNIFKYYNPKLATYIIDTNKVTTYRR